MVRFEGPAYISCTCGYVCTHVIQYIAANRNLTYIYRPGLAGRLTD